MRFQSFQMDFIISGMCFPFDVLDLGESVSWIEEDHDAHEVASSRRPRLYVGCNFKSVVVISWCKVNFVIVDFSVNG